MTKTELKTQLIQSLVNKLLGNRKTVKRKVSRKKVARKVDRKVATKRKPYTLKLSNRRLTKVLVESSALTNKSGDVFRVVHNSKNIFTLNNIRTNNNTIYYKADAFFREGFLQVNCAVDTTVDAYKVLSPINLK